ncbi:MAG: 3-deoxy-7-phosphoheptulonate synthase [Lentisphaerae bacterium]|jgi:3-deoxy-7-phosphoheptulonate synthase|nr:3-deoxy-7-phosphoheptulonate synthase [Lentisphaerota bacterium]MBT4815952.1 3-deoxy-7-phosphoheptulonate synthase [Lentisphaerota bacterium]MBT5606868.1 3-deoxy-7-phosphoheptulonate synthase [Lentisphaerota bacterium]MBT7059015.1 3-deoxy-7-phosphoheptulonate synthase [Lentisphaerota bacterium]MBT7843587.1 3-deoxy-7-phosphoheptulonate synthase [Lentisphaerota bacterium]
MVQTDNLNIEAIRPLSSPEGVKAELPLTTRAADTVVGARAQIENILMHRDPRQILVVGPCSVHDVESALVYAERLKALSDEVEERLLLVMRVYFEKPRTTLGWKGLIYDPDLDDSCDIDKGLRLARQVLLQVATLGMPAASEMLEPVIPQYITDLISWGAIGARTTESQTHRQLASGLSMPVGFKNATDGNLKVAVEAISTAVSAHTFIGITGDGKAAIFQTRGNAFGHLVLRGGTSGPNYGSEHVAYAQELMRKSGLIPNLLVDCSHANSGKRPEKQRVVVDDVMEQVRGGAECIVGMMLESNLKPGKQSMPDDPSQIVPGLSVTDACIGWDETEELVRYIYGKLGER